ncbi:endomembrane protein 70-domain containing protein [Nitzschia inconspicua]|uniref:Transmembrane 9 superfamily member n=1 Tax=Nitzschia inconspicua TaxID=303405 RepID=A0A9K3KTP9_9STRA|nr:endomembrane protein 70-domain containing protein [Nitzschia inconspicua]
MMTRMISYALATAMVLLPGATAFYIPGVQPHEFSPGEEVPMKVNAITSIHTQIPKDYYRLPFCTPTDGPQMASENLGEFLTGNKIQSSAYSINMLTELYCEKVCQKYLSKLEAAKLRLHIKYGYHNNWIIDNLPSAAVGLNMETGEKQKHYAGGFPIGFISSDTQKPFIFNHVNIIIDFHKSSPDVNTYRVVGFAVEPMSVKHRFQGNYEWDGDDKEGYNKKLATCPTGEQHMDRSVIEESQIVDDGVKILYTYDVIWKESDVAWSSRWDIYLSEDHLVPAQVHWYSITNSILVVLFLSLLVISILVRNLRRDIAAYNALAALADEERDEEMDESGWKLIHADVFRPPDNYPMLYCVFVGSGVQMLVTVFLSIVFSAVGFLNPARRGSLMNAILVFYMLSGVLAGYVSSRLYKSFKGRMWQLCTVVTAILFPGVAFCLFIFFNIILFFKQSSASAPFLDVIIVAAMWCCVSIPLVFVGAYFGYKKEAIQFPTVTSTIARAIPPPQPLLHPMVGTLVAGVVPFAAAYVELFFIMTSLWMDQYYYVFGFTLIVYLILIVTCAEVTVLLVYYQLCAENHRWWWFSFFAPGSTALYTFIYSVFWFRSLEASKMVMTYLLYFGYMGLICTAMLLITGTVGTLTSLWFVRKIFGTIKVD